MCDGLCGKQALLLAEVVTTNTTSSSWLKISQALERDSSGWGEKQGREPASGCYLCFPIAPSLGDGDPKLANSCLEIENS